jgi:type II secretory pathway component GspD/PulD (secretin)
MRICSHWKDITLDSKRFAPDLRHPWQKRIAMRNAIAALLFGLTFAALAQEVPRVYHFNTIQGAPAYQEVANTVRTIGDIREVTVDPTAGSMVVSGTADRMALVDWLLPQLDQAAGGAGSPEYQMPGNTGIVRIFRIVHAGSPRELQEIVNVMRTTADMARLLPVNSSGSVVARGTADQITLAAWLVSQLDVAGPDPVARIQASQLPGVPESEVRVIHLAHTTSPSALAELVNTIRTIADINRVFRNNTAAALVVRGEPQTVAVAEWLAGQLDQPANQQGPSPHEQAVKGRTDSVARVFYLSHTQSLGGLQVLANTLRTNVKIQRIFACTQVSAVSLRGTAEQVSEAEKLIAQLDR